MIMFHRMILQRFFKNKENGKINEDGRDRWYKERKVNYGKKEFSVQNR